MNNMCTYTHTLRYFCAYKCRLFFTCAKYHPPKKNDDCFTGWKRYKPQITPSRNEHKTNQIKPKHCFFLVILGFVCFLVWFVWEFFRLQCRVLITALSVPPPTAILIDSWPDLFLSVSPYDSFPFPFPHFTLSCSFLYLSSLPQIWVAFPHRNIALQFYFPTFPLQNIDVLLLLQPCFGSVVN